MINTRRMITTRIVITFDEPSPSLSSPLPPPLAFDEFDLVGGDVSVTAWRVVAA